MERCFDIATLRADARHEQRHLADDLAHPGDLAGESGPDDERTLAGHIPVAGDDFGDVLVQLLAADVEDDGILFPEKIADLRGRLLADFKVARELENRISDLLLVGPR